MAKQNNLQDGIIGFLVFVFVVVIGFLISIALYGLPDGMHWLDP